MRVALACAVVFASAAASDAKCMRVELAPKVETPAKATLPADGGVLVGWTSSTDAERSDADPSVQPTWTALGEKRAKLVLAIETLAPGLSVYRTKERGSFTIVDAKAKPIATFSRGGTVVLDLPAPAPNALEIDSGRGFKGHPESTVIAAFAAVPTKAVALVLYRIAGDKRVPLSFGLVDHAETSVVVYADRSHCDWNPPGTTLPAPTDQLGLAWVDAYGRLSPPSAPLKLALKH